MKFKRVLIIGNGDTILEYDYGKIIDSDYFDEVWRFNRFKTEGYEKCTGIKTDVWVSSFGGQVVRDLTTMNLKKLLAAGWELENCIKNNKVSDPYYKIYLEYVKMIKDNNLKTKMDYISNKIWKMFLNEKSEWYLDKTKIWVAKDTETFHKWIGREVVKDFKKEEKSMSEYSSATVGLATIVLNIIEGHEVWLHGHDLFKQEEKGYSVNSATHYFEDRVYACSHDFNKERGYVKNLIKNKKVLWLKDNLDKINE